MKCCACSRPVRSAPTDLVINLGGELQLCMSCSYLVHRIVEEHEVHEDFEPREATDEERAAAEAVRVAAAVKNAELEALRSAVRKLEELLGDAAARPVKIRE